MRCKHNPALIAATIICSLTVGRAAAGPAADFKKRIPPANLKIVTPELLKVWPNPALSVRKDGTVDAQWSNDPDNLKRIYEHDIGRLAPSRTGSSLTLSADQVREFLVDLNRPCWPCGRVIVISAASPAKSDRKHGAAAGTGAELEKIARELDLKIIRQGK
ncbi:MAG TPA: hypothetical protein V6C72_04270, partial [Chroococcales cyanobacterium]